MTEEPQQDLGDMVNEILEGRVIGTTHELVAGIEALHEVTHIFGDKALHDRYHDLIETIKGVDEDDEPTARLVMAEWIEGMTNAVQGKLRDCGIPFITFWVLHSIPSPGMPFPSFRRWTLRAEGSGLRADSK